jgi:hypothetical protein
MSREITGLSLTKFEEPIWDALEEYEAISEGRLELAHMDATHLKLTPDKPYSARSQTPVRFDREYIGDMYVIAFSPYDGTGDEETLRLGKTSVDQRLPQQPKIMPRSKAGIHSEGLLTLAQANVDFPADDPDLFEGSFELIGLKDDEVTEVGHLGHISHLFRLASRPSVTYTVGRDQDGERFGDPHAVYSALDNVVQVCGFLAVTNEVAKKHPTVLESLNARRPVLY